MSESTLCTLQARMEFSVVFKIIQRNRIVKIQKKSGKTSAFVAEVRI